MVKLITTPLFVYLYLFVNKPVTQQFVYMGVHNMQLHLIYNMITA